MGTTLGVWLDFNQWVCLQEGNRFGSFFARKLILFTLLLLVGALGYSRLFLGVHTLNQVLYGLSLGAWVALTMHCIVKEPLIELADELIAAKQTA